jgi:hypothetical protein
MVTAMQQKAATTEHLIACAGKTLESPLEPLVRRTSLLKGAFQIAADHRKWFPTIPWTWSKRAFQVSPLPLRRSRQVEYLETGADLPVHTKEGNRTQNKTPLARRQN